MSMGGFTQPKLSQLYLISNLDPDTVAADQDSDTEGEDRGNEGFYCKNYCNSHYSYHKFSTHSTYFNNN